MIFNTTGGANPLNFYVKTYPSEVELKADKPKENTNGVITTTTMTSWAFSATEPKEPEVGMVWIKVGTSSSAEFNALKKNTLQVYPVKAKQYESGKWADKPAYSYHSGEWGTLHTYIYKTGDNGSAFYVYLPSGSYAGQVTHVFGSDGISLKNTNGSNTYGIRIATNNKIDFADYSKLCAKVMFNSTGSNKVWTGLGVTPDRSGLTANYLAIHEYVSQSGSTGEHVYEVDISNVNTSGYVEYVFDAIKCTVDAKITSIWLE